MWRALGIFWLVSLSACTALADRHLVEEVASSSVGDRVFDPNLSEALQQALVEAALEQGADSLSASLYLSDLCYWEGATGVTEQDPDVRVEPDMLYGFGSITKTFVAAMVLQLVEENRLGLEDRLDRWLETYPNIDPSVTVRQLLNHSSGLGGSIRSDRFWSDVLANPNRIWAPEEVLRYAGRPSAAPGDGRHYSNTNYLLLGLIIEAVTGKPVEQALEDRITGPLGLTQTSLPKSDFDPPLWANSSFPSSSLYSAIWTAGALASTPRNVAKWGHRLFSGNVLQTASLERMLVFSDKRIGPVTVPMGLGVWDLSVGDVVAWGHGGRLDPFLARMFYLPDLRLSVAYASSGGRDHEVPGVHLARAYRAHQPEDISVCFDAPN